MTGEASCRKVSWLQMRQQRVRMPLVIKVYKGHEQIHQHSILYAPDQAWAHKGPLCESLDRFAARGNGWQSRFSRPTNFAESSPPLSEAGRLRIHAMSACCGAISSNHSYLQVYYGRLGRNSWPDTTFREISLTCRKGILFRREGSNPGYNFPRYDAKRYYEQWE